MSPARPNATRTDIIAMLRDGHSNNRIVRELRCDKQRVIRLRNELDLPAFVRAEQTRTIEEKWALSAKPVDDGHMEWTGARGTASGTPVLSYKDNLYTAAAIAFRIKQGREPRGYVKAECGFPHCVAPDHVNDEPGRQQARREVRAQRGLGDVPETCVSGHDQAEHVKFEPDGRAYCGLCKLLDKRAQRDPSQQRPQRLRASSLDEAFRAHLEPVDGGHVRWTGSTSHTTPTVWFAGTTQSAYRIAFRLHHGREPQGLVTPGCDVPLCVAGAHVEDRPMRQRTDSLFTAIFGAAA